MAKQVRRLLAVSWALPPLLTPRSLQVGRLLDALARIGWKIDVICVEAKSVPSRQIDETLDSQYNKLLSVHRVPEAITTLPKMVLAKLFPLLLPLPDPADPWVKRATLAGKQLLRNKKYQAVLSFGQPWTSHIAGQNLKRISNLPWLAHFSDPWVDNPYSQGLSAGQQAKMFELERTVMASADKLIFTNKPAASVAMRKYPQNWKRKVDIIPHAFDHKMITRSAQPPIKSNCMRFVYTGSFYGLRNPRNLILALGGMRQPGNVMVEIAGLIKDVETYKRLANKIGVGDMVKFSSQMTYRESLNLAAKADVLLLIDAPSEKSLFLPSKLVDYLIFEKPILGITPKKGAAADLLYELSYPVAPPDDVDKIMAAMQKMFKQWQSHKLKCSNKHYQIAQRYEIGQVVRKFAGSINSVIH